MSAPSLKAIWAGERGWTDVDLGRDHPRFTRYVRGDIADDLLEAAEAVHAFANLEQWQRLKAAIAKAKGE